MRTTPLSAALLVMATTAVPSALAASKALRPPDVQTLGATLVPPTSATIRGTVNPNGQSTLAWFEWGTTTQCGNTTTVTNAGSGNEPVLARDSLGGIVPSSTYHFRLVAVNASGVSHGLDGLIHAPTTNTVTSLNDSGPGSLRQTLAASGPGDTITFAVTGVVVLLTGALLIDRDLQILGPGPALLSVSGNKTNRVFMVNSNLTVFMSGLTIRDGKAPSGTNGVNVTDTTPGTPGGAGQHGGGIYNHGFLTLSNCIVTENVSGSGGDGGDRAISGEIIWPLSGGDAGKGGGSFNDGTLSVIQSSVTRNTTGIGGRGYTNSAGTLPNGGDGGGICNVSTMNLISCTLLTNTTGNGQSGIVDVFTE